MDLILQGRNALAPGLGNALQQRQAATCPKHLGFIAQNTSALLRPKMAAKKLMSSRELQRVPNGRVVRTAGIVTLRQQPATAKGTIFVSLEDEFGSVQVIVWRSVREDLLPWLTAAVVAVAAAWLLPPGWYVMVGALAGGLMGAWRHGR